VKRCYACGIEKPFDEFHRRSRSRDGYDDRCKPCKSDYGRAYYAANREVIARKQLDRYYADIDASREKCRQYAAEHRDEARARARKWYWDNHERALEAGRQFRLANPTKNIEWASANPDYHENWKRTNRDKVLSYAANRRARKRNSWIEDVDRQVVWQRDKGLCGICTLAVDPDDWDLEHIIPLSGNGEHSYANTRVSHPICNGWKGTRLDSELPSIPEYVLEAAYAAEAIALARAA